MACPHPPDSRVRACKLAAPTEEFLIARIVRVEDVVGVHSVVIAMGTSRGVTRRWRAEVLAGDEERVLDGGVLQIVNVTEETTVARTGLTAEAIAANPRVRLVRPE